MSAQHGQQTRTPGDLHRPYSRLGGDDAEHQVEKPEPTDDTEYEAYPDLSPLVRPDVLFEFIDYGKSRRCVVDFATRIEAAHVYRTDDWIDPWFELLEAGAFALPVGCASETDSIAGALTLFDEQALEITVNRFQASEAAWSALINMLDACWSQAPLLSTVTVE